MSPSRPVLFLDIDGVLNSLLKEPPAHAWLARDWHKADYIWNGIKWPLLWSAPVVDWLKGLDVRVEVRWHTTWQDQAHDFAKIVGLPEDWVIADAPEFAAARDNWSDFAKSQIMAHQPTWWKYQAARRVLADEQRPLIWIDDGLELKMVRGQRRSLLAHELPCLFLSPDGHTGIMHKHMAQVEGFLASLEEVRGAVSGS